MMSALGSKLSLNSSRQRESNDAIFVPLDADRSNSRNRGREFHSTGRGGIGNFRETSGSSSRDARVNSGPNDYSPVRGRDLYVRHDFEPFHSPGRGGTGNLCPPSRDPSKLDPTEVYDEKNVHENLADQTVPHLSTGRGGLGNISRSRSRDLNKANTLSSTLYSSGRGGGNIHPGPAISESIDEERQKVENPHDKIKSMGRGGAVNITSAPESNVEYHKNYAQNYESTGRGGAGNIVHS